MAEMKVNGLKFHHTVTPPSDIAISVVMGNVMQNWLQRTFIQRSLPFVAVVFLQFGLAGMDILCKAALNDGMSNYVFIVYRHAAATLVMSPFAIVLDRKIRPRMTVWIFAKMTLLALLEPVMGQNLYFMGMKYTSATFAATMTNVLPAITFAIAWLLRVEKVDLRSLRSYAKIGGTLATVGGAMLMTLLRGPVIKTFWTEGRSHRPQLPNHGDITLHNSIKGSLMITAGSFGWAFFMVLQAITLRTYPPELSMTACICLLGTVEGSIIALMMERGRPNVWAIHLDIKLLASLYSGVFCSGLAYYIQSLIMKKRGPVFITAFSPLNMVIVAIISTFALGEKLFLGRLIGATIIVGGLYLVIWGKSNDRCMAQSTNSKAETLEEHSLA